MKVLTKKEWRGGFLDYYQDNQDCRLKILAFKNLEELKGIYFVRPKSPKMLLNYLKKFGFKATARKTASRLKESLRNKKYISCGIAEVLDSPDNNFPKGTIVGFIAPLHPPLVERLALPRGLIFELDSTLSFLKENQLLYLPETSSDEDKWWQPLKAWSKYSGLPLKEDLERTYREAKKSLEKAEWQKAQVFSTQKPDPIRESWGAPPKSFSPEKAVLFGYGHYGKTNIIPNIKPLEIVSVHEIDPLQIGIPKIKKIKYWDTSPLPRREEENKYGVYFIASFHHTHAPLAIEALKRGAHAIVEKPIATEKNQLEDLISAMKNSQKQLFSAFHKRYSPLNRFIFRDLKNSENTPINYHAIIYEVPLPKFHWYRWPNSKSSIVTNGCHWIDQFLFLNNFSEAKKYGLSLSSDKRVINLWAELENGAYFTMAITDKGSEYIGVRDYVELRTEDKTAKIIDDSVYIAEGKSGLIRKVKINKMENYREMYQTIAQKIIKGQKGDSIKSVEVSSGLILGFEEKFREMI